MNFVSNLVAFQQSKFCENIIQITLTMKENNKSLKLNGGKQFPRLTQGLMAVIETLKNNPG